MIEILSRTTVVVMVDDQQISSTLGEFPQPNLNTERSYKREGHAPLKRFVGFQTDQYNGGWRR